MREDLMDFLADMVTEEKWSSAALTRLFSMPQGTWIPVPALCEDISDALEEYQTLMQNSDIDIMGTWLPHPAQPEQGFLIFFYDDEEMSSSVSIVTRAYLQKVLPEEILLQCFP